MRRNHFTKQVKRAGLVLCWLFLAHNACATATLQGVIKKNATDGAPFATVTIAGHGANQFKTPANGLFSLTFPDKRVGDEVNLIVSAPPGWKVLHELMLTHTLPKAGGRIAEIILCKINECDQLAINYFRIKSMAAVEKEFAARSGLLAGKLDAKQEEIANLRQERDQALQRANDLAQQFSKVPQGGTTAQYRQAWQLYLDGKIDTALSILSEAALEQEDAEIEDRKHTSVNSWILRGRMSNLLGKFSDAGKAYSKAVARDPGNYHAWFEYGAFYQAQNHFEQAHVGYAYALPLAVATNDAILAAGILHALGALAGAENNGAQAQSSLTLAIGLNQTSINELLKMQQQYALMREEISSLDVSHAGKAGIAWRAQLLAMLPKLQELLEKATNGLVALNA